MNELKLKMEMVSWGDLSVIRLAVAGSNILWNSSWAAGSRFCWSP